MSQILKCIICRYYTNPGIMHVCQLATGGEPVRAVYAAEKAPCVDCATYRRYADQAREEIATLRQRAKAAERRVAELEAFASANAWARVNIRKRWSFDNNQQHTHSWHDREDFCAEWNRRYFEAIDAAGGTHDK